MIGISPRVKEGKMTDREKVLVLKLIAVVEHANLPIRTTLGRLAEAEAEHEHRAEVLGEALAAVRALT